MIFLLARLDGVSVFNLDYEDSCLVSALCSSESLGLVSELKILRSFYFTTIWNLSCYGLVSFGSSFTRPDLDICLSQMFNLFLSKVDSCFGPGMCDIEI